MYSSNLKGFILAVVSSAFIGSSFIIKKKGLRRAGVNGPRASNLSNFYFLTKFLLLFSFSNLILFFLLLRRRWRIWLSVGATLVGGHGYQ